LVSPQVVPQEASGGAPAFSVGDSVEARFGGDPEWFPGTVDRANGGHYAIAYADGDYEASVPKAWIRKTGGRAQQAPPPSAQPVAQPARAAPQPTPAPAPRNPFTTPKPAAGNLTRVSLTGGSAGAVPSWKLKLKSAVKTATKETSVIKAFASTLPPPEKPGQVVLRKVTVPLQPPAAPPPQHPVGARVEARFGGGAEWFAGSVDAVSSFLKYPYSVELVTPRYVYLCLRSPVPECLSTHLPSVRYCGWDLRGGLRRR